MRLPKADGIERGYVMKKRILSLVLMVCLLSSLMVALPIAVGAATEYREGYYTYTVENGTATITDCYHLISGDISIPSTLGGYSVTSIGDAAFYDCGSLTSITIPDGVTSIGDYAFEYCSSLTSITIPDGVASIGGSAFSDCESLTSITIPDSVTSIGGSAFCGCESLTSITIPDSVTIIGYRVFSSCSSLTSISIPDSVTRIATFAFYSCARLSDVYYGGSEADWAAISIGWDNECLTNATIHYNSVGAVAPEYKDPIQFDAANNKAVIYSPKAMDGVQLITASYAGDKLTHLKPVTVNLLAGKNEFDIEVLGAVASDKLKIFVWDVLSNLNPLFNNCAVDLK